LKSAKEISKLQLPELQKKVKQDMRLFFGLTNICAPAAENAELHNKIQAEALQLNYKIKAFITASSSTDLVDIITSHIHVTETIADIVQQCKNLFAQSKPTSEEQEDIVKLEIEIQLDEENTVKDENEKISREENEVMKQIIPENNESPIEIQKVPEDFKHQSETIHLEPEVKTTENQTINVQQEEKKNDTPMQGWKRVQFTEYQKSHLDT